MTRLTGKRALVTGGSRGIGAAIARRLAAEGADVALTYTASADAAEQVAAQIVKGGRKALAIRADNRDAAAVEAAVNQAAEALGGLDILVNNAGIWAAAPGETLSLEAFDETIAVNLRAAFVAVRAALPHMGEGGRIVAIGSNLAIRAPHEGLAAYAASKAGLAAMSQALARDLGPRGITVNTVHPGSTDTDMNPANGEHAGPQVALMARKHYADPAEVAAAVAFLAAPEAQSITGAALTIDNGQNA
ncbi:SDR family oxidoreductase [Sphingosinicella sp. LHD-64]|uniref:SDR family NAD(P)-dependent oxidoreductase n=1 Tax=Sphingosinicella sp. LHD-64 TaxID=3072139 RepID=UPI00280ED452|nr:SDR family NAD(P)-dependent oxidoreductase [Sphingosinicella sp. LHD-64]MDQ8756705.1 SDR family oxidoreductase [Sphingosinicella sp. LHD-64]